MSLVLNVEILGEFKKLTQATTGAEKSLNTLKKGVGNISKSINGTLAAIGIGFSLNAVVGGIKGAVEAASELEQQGGALESVFKDLAPEMKQFASELSPIGLSSAEASRSMALLGAQLKGYGLPVEEASKKTKDLTLLAADLAATFGGTTADAVASIGSLFRGEYDPIEKYGVAIKQSDINARLAAEGLDKLTGEALKQATAQTALTMLFEKTADAQGQSARESNTYASQMAFLNAEFENTKAELGQALIPIFVELAQEVRGNIPQIRELVAQFIDFVKWVGEATLYVIKHKDQLIPLATAVLGIAAAYKTVTIGIGAYNTIAALATGSTNALNVSMKGILGTLGLVLAGLQAIEAINSRIRAGGGLASVPASSPGNTFIDSPLTSPNPGSFTNMAPSVPAPSKTKAPVIPKSPTNTPKVSSNTTNINVNVKKSTATGTDIAKAVNKTIKTVGTNVIRAM